MIIRAEAIRYPNTLKAALEGKVKTCLLIGDSVVEPCVNDFLGWQPTTPDKAQDNLWGVSQ